MPQTKTIVIFEELDFILKEISFYLPSHTDRTKPGQSESSRPRVTSLAGPLLVAPVFHHHHDHFCCSPPQPTWRLWVLSQ